MANKKRTTTDGSDSESLERPDNQVRDISLDDFDDDRKELFRNTYGTRHVARIPESKKNPLLHYLIVPNKKVKEHLDKGYKVDTRFNGHISEEMIGRANKLGSVSSFNDASGNIIMVIPKEWADERDRKEQEMRDAQYKLHTEGKMDTKSNASVTGVDTKDIEL